MSSPRRQSRRLQGKESGVEWSKECHTDIVTKESTSTDQDAPTNTEDTAALNTALWWLRAAQVHRFWMTPALMMSFWRQEDARQGTHWAESQVNYPLMMFSIYMLLWELPSGFIADHIGRRTSLALSVVCYAVARSLWGFIDISYASNVSAVLEAAAQALYSGSLEALIHELCRCRAHCALSHTMCVSDLC